MPISPGQPISYYNPKEYTCQAKSLLFVHGTLKHGGYNWKHYLADQQLVAKGVLTTGRFKMRDVGFPMLCPEYYIGSGSDLYQVKGDLFLVNQVAFEDLDRLEGTPTHFQRIITGIDYNNCQAYIYVNHRQFDTNLEPKEGSYWEWN